MQMTTINWADRFGERIMYRFCGIGTVTVGVGPTEEQVETICMTRHASGDIIISLKTPGWRESTEQRIIKNEIQRVKKGKDGEWEHLLKREEKRAETKINEDVLQW